MNEQEGRGLLKKTREPGPAFNVLEMQAEARWHQVWI